MAFLCACAWYCHEQTHGVFSARVYYWQTCALSGQVLTLEEEVTLQEEMNVEEVETQKEEEVTVKPAEAATADMELETSLRLS